MEKIEFSLKQSGSYEDLMDSALVYVAAELGGQYPDRAFDLGSLELVGAAPGDNRSRRWCWFQVSTRRLAQ